MNNVEVTLTEDKMTGSDNFSQIARDALKKLREARDLLRSVGATQALKRVRSAIKSAEGAARNAELRKHRSIT